MYGINNDGANANVGAVNGDGRDLNRLPRNARNDNGGGAAFRAFGGRGVRIGGE
jgi:hypothetical protein